MKEASPFREKRLSRRRLPKGRVKLSLQLGVTGCAPNLSLSLLNLSETGACMAVKQAVEPGREVTAELEAQAFVRPVVCAGNVAWCKPAEGGAFMVGITFRQRLPYYLYRELTQEPPSYLSPAAKRGRGTAVEERGGG